MVHSSSSSSSSCSSSSSSCSSIRTRSRRRIEDSREVLQAMILREERHYHCPNYLSLDSNNHQKKTVDSDRSTASTCTTSSSSSSSFSSLSSLSLASLFAMTSSTTSTSSTSTTPATPELSLPSAKQIIEEISNIFADAPLLVDTTTAIVSTSTSATAAVTALSSSNSSSNNNSNSNSNNIPEEIPKQEQQQQTKVVSPVSSADDLYALANLTTTTTTANEEDGNGNEDKPTSTQCKKQQQHYQHRLTIHDTHSLNSWRNQMYDWACAVRDSQNFFDINDTVLEIAFNILDRYIAIELNITSTSISSSVAAPSSFFSLSESSSRSSLSASSTSSSLSALCRSSFYNNNNDTPTHETILLKLPVTREDYQLFAMVSLYIASKLVINRSQHHYYHLHTHQCHNEEEAMNEEQQLQYQQQPYHQNKQYLDVTTLMDMSQGFYTQEDITTTEGEILAALDWHVHTPTIIDYCDIYLDLFDSSTSKNSNNNNNDNNNSDHKKEGQQFVHARCQQIITDVVLTDGEFFLEKAHSVIALAIVLLATDAARSGRCGSIHKHKHGHGRDKNLKRRNSSSSSSRSSGSNNRRRQPHSRRSSNSNTNSSDYFGDSDEQVVPTFLQNIQGVVNVNEQDFDAIIRRLECSY